MYLIISQDEWFNDVRKRLLNATPISNYLEVDQVTPNNKYVIIEYNNDSHFEKMAKYFNIMYDEKVCS